MLGSRLLWSRLALAVVAPLATLGLLEAGLRLMDAGYPTSFLVQRPDGARHAWVSNPFYGYRFFDPRIARNPAPLHLAAPKRPGVTRLAVLGESAAMGDPAIEFSLARGLEKMLNRGQPDRPYEVVNAAMTAINSPVIVDLASELAHREVDGFIIYMGNNEVVGPFGPGTVLTSSRWGNRLNPWRVQLSRLRLAGFLRILADHAGRRQPKDRPANWAGMEMFGEQALPADNPRLSAMYARFEANLGRLLDLADRHDIRVVVCTVAVNVTDCAPFASTNRPGLSGGEREAWQQTFQAGRKAYQTGALEEARTFYEKATALDDSHAELNFRLARILDQQGQTGAARRRYERARDLDLQRFRADSEINRIIRRVAQAHPGVVLADAEQAFAALPDQDTFVDHVHFSLAGLHALCRTVQGALSAWYPVPPALEATEFRDQLFVSPWSERKQASLMLARRQRPPFLLQWQNQDHLVRLQQQLTQAQQAIATQDLDHVEATVRNLRAAAPDDAYYAQQWGYVLCVEKQWARAADALDQALADRTGYSDGHNLAALARAMSGQPEVAAQRLLETGPPYGYYLADAALMVMDTLYLEQRPAEARAFAETLLRGASAFPGRDRIHPTTQPNRHDDPS